MLPEASASVQTSVKSAPYLLRVLPVLAAKNVQSAGGGERGRLVAIAISHGNFSPRKTGPGSAKKKKRHTATVSLYKDLCCIHIEEQQIYYLSLLSWDPITPEMLMCCGEHRAIDHTYARANIQALARIQTALGPYNQMLHSVLYCLHFVCRE